MIIIKSKDGFRRMLSLDYAGEFVEMPNKETSEALFFLSNRSMQVVKANFLKFSEIFVNMEILQPEGDICE